MAADTWTEHARAVLGSRGYRRGGAREAVIGLLAEQTCALSAQAIDDALRKQGERPVGRASIYRALEILVEHRLVQRLEVGQAVALYEAIDPTGDHHHHLLCDHCGRLVPFDDRDLERSIERLGDRHGFRVEDHEVVLHGACASCET